MADVGQLLVLFMDYMGMSLGNNIPQSGQEYRFKNFAFRNSRHSEIRRGLDRFWRQTGFELQGEYEDGNTLTFSILSRAEPTGFEIRFTFEEKDCDLIVVFNYPEAFRALSDFDQQFLGENRIKMA